MCNPWHINHHLQLVKTSLGTQNCVLAKPVSQLVKGNIDVEVFTALDIDVFR